MAQSTTVEYRQLGKSGLRVSVPIAECPSAVLCGPYVITYLPVLWVVPEEKAIQVLKAAWDLGINDTANIYSNGESEKIIAAFIRKYNIPRENITKVNGLVTKDVSVQSFMIPGILQSRDHINNFGLSRIAIFSAVDASLARLQTTYINLLQIHRPDPRVPVEETMKALHDLVQAGKVRYIGASTVHTYQFQHMNYIAQQHGWTEFVSMQPEYSLLYREEEREMIRYCNFKGIGVIPYSPLASGDLARPIGASTSRLKQAEGTPFERPLRAVAKKSIQTVQELAVKHGCTMSQIALAWVATKTTTPIVGIGSVGRLYSSIFTGVSLDEEEIKYLEEPYEPLAPKVF